VLFRFALKAKNIIKGEMNMKKIKLIRTEKGMTYRRPKEYEGYEMGYSAYEMWNYISREGGIWE